jgi:hypothetical protein
LGDLHGKWRNIAAWKLGGRSLSFWLAAAAAAAEIIQLDGLFIKKAMIAVKRPVI